jgi:uncharacterized membrane protein
MKLRHWYLLLSLAGAALPLSQFVVWLVQSGLDLPLFIRELFANRISSFFALDVIVSACVVFTFAAAEGTRSRLRFWWLPVIATATVGVSLGLPLLLYLREIDRSAGSSS